VPPLRPTYVDEKEKTLGKNFIWEGKNFGKFFYLIWDKIVSPLGTPLENTLRTWGNINGNILITWWEPLPPPSLLP
jgi:hypothetical protein